MDADTVNAGTISLSAITSVVIPLMTVVGGIFALAKAHARFSENANHLAKLAHDLENTIKTVHELDKRLHATEILQQNIMSRNNDIEKNVTRLVTCVTEAQANINHTKETIADSREALDKDISRVNDVVKDMSSKIDRIQTDVVDKPARRRGD